MTDEKIIKPMVGFELWTSGLGGQPAANWATTSAVAMPFFPGHTPAGFEPTLFGFQGQSDPQGQPKIFLKLKIA